MGKILDTTRTRSGMALVMMLILVPVLMFLAMSFVDPIVRSYRSAVNDQKTLLAKNVADSMFEVALWQSRGTGIGENVCNDQYPDGEIFEYDFGDATVRWCVMGSSEISEEDVESKLIHGTDYTIPAPGSGTAGDDYCSTNEPIVTETMLTSFLTNTLDFSQAEIDNLGAFYNTFSWPCHWNKLHEGESITIPLYTEDSEGNVYHPFEVAGVNDFTLKIRAACDPEEVDREDEYTNEICNDNERYVLVGDQPFPNKTVLVLWEITGRLNDEEGETVYLTHKKSGTIFNPKTALDVETINLQTPLTEDSTARKSIDKFEDSIENFISTLYKPELKLLVVHTLNDNTGVVPYLEYQFSSTYNASSTPVANTSKVVHVEVMVDGGYSETIDKIVDIAKSVSGFVIQQ